MKGIRRVILGASVCCFVACTALSIMNYVEVAQRHRLLSPFAAFAVDAAAVGSLFVLAIWSEPKEEE